MSRLVDQGYLAGTQYRDASCLGARAYLHRRFSTSQTNWQRWIWSQLNLPSSGRILNHDALVITESEPLIAYTLSTSCATALRPRLGEFSCLIENEIVAKGAIRMRKESGLFEANKAQFCPVQP